MTKHFSLNKPQIKSLQICLKETPIKGCFRPSLNKFLEPKKKKKHRTTNCLSHLHLPLPSSSSSWSSALFKTFSPLIGKNGESVPFSIEWKASTSICLDFDLKRKFIVSNPLLGVFFSRASEHVRQDRPGQESKYCSPVDFVADSKGKENTERKGMNVWRGKHPGWTSGKGLETWHDSCFPFVLFIRFGSPFFGNKRREGREAEDNFGAFIMIPRSR